MGYLPGGIWWYTSKVWEIYLDFDTLQSMIVLLVLQFVILSDKVDMREIGLNLMKFFEDESCGGVPL